MTDFDFLRELTEAAHQSPYNTDTPISLGKETFQKAVLIMHNDGCVVGGLKWESTKTHVRYTREETLEGGATEKQIDDFIEKHGKLPFRYDTKVVEWPESIVLNGYIFVASGSEYHLAFGSVDMADIDEENK